MDSITKIVILLMITMQLILAKQSFKKSSGMDLEFPPEIKQTPSGVPLGHLRPLGWQRRPEDRIAFMESDLTPRQFYELYGKDSKPVAFTNMLTKENTPAKSKWTDAYMKKTFGDVEVMVTKTEEDKDPVDKRMTLSEFLDDYEQDTWYIANSMPKRMMKDLPLPKCIQCGSYSRYLMEAELWMSSGGTASKLHYHADEHLHCLLDGRKDFILMEKKYQSQLKFVESKPHAGEGHSIMNTDMLNMFEFKAVADIPWYYATLRAGDCIYIPSVYLHQVRSYGRSISSVVQWAAPQEPDFADCETWTLRGDFSLADTSFMWINDGYERLSNTKLKAETLRHHLLALLRKDDILHSKRFKYFFDKAMSKMKKKPPSKEVFRHLDKVKTGILTRQEIRNMDKDSLETVALILNTAHSSQRLKDEL